MKRHLSYIFCLLIALPGLSQKMTITTLDGGTVDVEIVPDSVRKILLKQANGQQDNSLRKRWTARTYRLADNRLLLEFYSREAAVIRNLSDFKQLQNVHFIKTYINFLKKTVSYKIELPYEQGKELSKTARRLSKLKGDYYEVFQLPTQQILYLTDTSAIVYENLKALSSENSHVSDRYYKSDEWTKHLIGGDPLFDFEPNEHQVYPRDIARLIKNHKLTPVETKVYVSNFFGTLYRSPDGYYVLIDEIFQPNGAGDRMPIVSVRIYETMDKVKAARARYEKLKNEGVRSEHFYQYITNKYGSDFPKYAARLIDTLPAILNFDKDQLTFDSVGMDIVNEAILWNHDDFGLFNEWMPAVLAYYGQCYMTMKKDGKWVMKKAPDNVIVPYLVLADGTNAFDPYDFYKALYEWPSDIRWAGDWSGWQRDLEKRIAPVKNGKD